MPSTAIFRGSPPETLGLQGTSGSWSTGADVAAYSGRLYNGENRPRPRLRIRVRGQHWFHKVAETLNRLAQLQDNWDSYGGQSPGPIAIQAAFGVLAQVLDSDTPVPSIVPLRSGWLQMEWHTRRGDLEVTQISPTIVHFYFSQLEDGEEKEDTLMGDFGAIRGFLHRIQ